MMHKLKKSLKIGFFVLGSLLFCTNCENEIAGDIKTQEQSKFNIKTLNSNQINSNEQIVKRLSNLKPKGKEYNNSNANQRVIYNSNLGFSIDTDYVKYLENTENGYHSYSFPITRDSITHNKVENLLLALNNDGEYNAFIVTYDFTKQEYQDLDYNTIVNSTTIYESIDFDTTIFTQNELGKTTYYCIEVWDFVYGWDSGHGYLHGPGCNDTCGEFVLISNGCGFAYSSETGNGTTNGTDGGTDGSTTGGSPDGTDQTEEEIDLNDGHGLASVPAFETVEDDCPQPSADLIVQMDAAFGSANYEFDCDIDSNGLPSFGTVAEAVTFFDNLLDNNFSNESSETESALSSIRNDIHKMEFTSFPQADLVASIKVNVPDANNALECLEILNTRVNLEGNITFFNWNQFGSENPTDSNGPTVEINEALDIIKVSVEGELVVGLNIDGYPIKRKELITVEVVYVYSTGMLNTYLSHWHYTY